jgi:hypothetical protein
VGWALLGEPQWQWSGLRPGSVFPIQLGFVVLGAIGSMGVSRHISKRDYPSRSALAAAPWMTLTRHFGLLLIDHEGRFAVEVTVDGPLGTAMAASTVEATYDQRPPPLLLVVYLAPFVLVGALWTKLLLRRRGRGTA